MDSSQNIYLRFLAVFGFCKQEPPPPSFPGSCAICFREQKKRAGSVGILRDETPDLPASLSLTTGARDETDHRRCSIENTTEHDLS